MDILTYSPAASAKLFSLLSGFKIRFSPLGTRDYNVFGLDNGFIASYATFEDASAFIQGIEEGGEYSDQTVEGGTNYIERLMKWVNAPEGVKFVEGHFPGHENVLGYFRGKTRQFGGTSAFVIDEMQSGWHQQGREEGYLTPEESQERRRLLEKINTLNKEMKKTSEKEIASLKALADTEIGLAITILKDMVNNPLNEVKFQIEEET
ncbi:hypothetical protein LCGC14_3028360, partial [marine sediment metagenome]